MFKMNLFTTNDGVRVRVPESQNHDATPSFWRHPHEAWMGAFGAAVAIARLCGAPLRGGFYPNDS
jgi:hypothetical protein